MNKTHCLTVALALCSAAGVAACGHERRLYASENASTSGSLDDAPRVAGYENVVSRRVSTSPLLRPNGDISRDGRFFFAASGVRDAIITRLDLVTGKVDTVATFDGGVDNLRLSPDGKRIAATVWVDVVAADSGRFDGTTVWILGTDGSAKRQLIRRDYLADLQVAGWTPDSRNVLVLAQRDSGSGSHYRDDTYFGLLSVERGTLRSIAEAGQNWPLRTRMSPDGRFVAYTDQDEPHARTRVRIFNVADGKLRDLVTPVANEQLLEWAPDGRAVLFSSERGGTTSVWMQTVVDGRGSGEPRLVKPDVWRIGSIGMTDKGTLEYLVNVGGQSVGTLTYDPGAGRLVSQPTPVDPRAAGGTIGGLYSQDGKYFAYLARRGMTNPNLAPTFLVVKSVDGGEVRELPISMKNSILVNWFADGRHVLVEGQGAKSREGYIVDLATGKMESTPYHEPPWITLGRPVPTSDGRHLVRGLRDTSRADQWETADNLVAIMDLKTGADRVIGRISHMVRLDPSLGARSFTAVVEDGTINRLKLYSLDGDRIQFVRDLGTYESSNHGRNASNVTWTMDGSSVIVSTFMHATEPAHSEILRFPVNGGPVEHLFELPFTASINSIHPDGRHFAYLQWGTEGAELWALEGFLH